MILVGLKYWTGLLVWLNEKLLDEGKVSKDDMEIIQLEDDIDKIVKIVSDFWEIIVWCRDVDCGKLFWMTEQSS